MAVARLRPDCHTIVSESVMAAIGTWYRKTKDISFFFDAWYLGAGSPCECSECGGLSCKCGVREEPGGEEESSQDEPEEEERAVGIVAAARGQPARLRRQKRGQVILFRHVQRLCQLVERLVERERGERRAVGREMRCRVTWRC